MDPHASNKIHPEIPEQDPANDINGKLTWTWLLGSTVGVFVTFWLLAIFTGWKSTRPQLRLRPSLMSTRIEPPTQGRLVR